MIWKLIFGPTLPILLLAGVSIFATLSTSSDFTLKTELLIATGVVLIWAIAASIWTQGMAGWIQRERHKEIRHSLRSIQSVLNDVYKLMMEEWKPDSAVIQVPAGYATLPKPSWWRRFRENLRRVSEGLEE